VGPLAGVKQITFFIKLKKKRVKTLGRNGRGHNNWKGGCVVLFEGKTIFPKAGSSGDRS